MKTLMIGLAVAAALPRASSAQGPGAHQSVRVSGADLRYLEQGKGVPVILVHGGLEDYRAWQPQMAPLSERYRVIAYSRRHNYPNPTTPAGTDYSAAVDAEDLAALIGTLKLAPAHVVGVSYGAYAALLLAVRHPDLVRSLVLSEPPLMRWLPELPGGKPLFDEFMSKVWEPATRGFREGDEAGVRAAADGFGDLGYSGSDAKMTFATLPPEYQELLRQNAAEWKALTMSRNAFPDVAQNAVGRMLTPTLLLSGERSLALHHMIDGRLEALLPQQERIVVPAATHEMWNEYPEKCRSAALAFFAKH